MIRRLPLRTIRSSGWTCRLNDDSLMPTALAASATVRPRRGGEGRACMARSRHYVRTAGRTPRPIPGRVCDSSRSPPSPPLSVAGDICLADFVRQRSRVHPARTKSKKSTTEEPSGSQQEPQGKRRHRATNFVARCLLLPCGSCWLPDGSSVVLFLLLVLAGWTLDRCRTKSARQISPATDSGGDGGDRLESHTRPGIGRGV